ncbi:FerI, variant 2 [Balamuthia mandrillaris]
MGDLVVTIVEARNLIAGDSNGLSDPYACLSVGKTKFKTKTIKKTLNPRWEESFFFTLPYPPEQQRLKLKVFDWDMIGSDDRLGKTWISLNFLIRGQEHGGWYPLEGVPHGEVYLRLLPTGWGRDPQDETLSSNRSAEETYQYHQQQPQSVSYSPHSSPSFSGSHHKSRSRGSGFSSSSCSTFPCSSSPSPCSSSRTSLFLLSRSHSSSHSVFAA